VTLTDRILEACTDPLGMGRADLSTTLEKRYSIISASLDWLMSRGRIHRAGVYRHYRFFTSKADADAWDLLAEADYIAIRQAARVKILADKARREREKRASTMKVYKPRAKAAPKPAPHQHFVIRQERVAEPAQPATVIWPDSVKVQKIPTPKDTRFTFEPKPGWRGAITSDLIDRRMSEQLAA
jgi:hypothetical protein